MSCKMRIVSVSLLVMTLLLLLTTQLWAQGPADFTEYTLHLQLPGEGKISAEEMWFQTQDILSDLETQGLLQWFERVETENLVNVSTGLDGLHQLQKLDWIVRIERRTPYGNETVYDAQLVEPSLDAGAVEEATRMMAPLAPNDVTGIVDLPDGTPVQNMSVTASEVEGGGGEWNQTDPNGAYTLTLDTDGWWDVYLGSVPLGYNGYVLPLDWNRHLNITTDTVQNFTLLPISYTITGTVRYTGTSTPVPGVMVSGNRLDGGYSVSGLSNASGLYELDVSTGTYTVTLAATTQLNGYAPPFEYSGEVVDMPGTSVSDVDQWVWPLDKVITGTVTDKDTGESIGNAQLSIQRTDGLYQEYDVRTETSGLTGTYVVSVTNGVYQVSLGSYGQPAGYALPATDTHTVTVSGSSVPNVDFQLLPMNRHILGRVTNKDTGTGIGGVQMYVGAISGMADSNYATTDASGYYTFTVTEGEFDVSLPWSPPSGYAQPVTTTKRVEVTTGDVADVDFTLLPKDKSISGRATVQDIDTGVEGVQMELYSHSSWSSIYTDTDSGGYYTFTNQAEGDYSVYVNAVPAGYAALPPTERQVEITTTNRSEVNFEMLAADQTIRGTVSEEGNGGIQGVEVTVNVYDADYAYQAKATTDASGAYTVAVPPGKFGIYATLPVSYAGRDILRAPAGASGVDFTFQHRSETITGQVTDHNGSPLADVSVSAVNYDCYPDDWSGYDANTKTDANGTYTLTVLSGHYEISVRKIGYPTPPYQDAQAGDSGVDFAMPEGFLIRGWVASTQDGEGTAFLPNASVYAYNAAECASSRHNRSTNADTNGYYTLTVGAGTYSVYAYQWGYGAPLPQTVTVGPDQDDVNFTLSPKLLITGTVKYPTGQPVERGWVRTTGGPGYDSHTFYSWDNGYYELQVVSGTYDVTAEIYNWPDPATITDVVVVTHTGNVNFTAPEAYTVTGVVSDTDGAPWTNIAVNAEGLGTLNEDEWDNTDNEGRYALHVLRGGTYSFYPNKWMYPSNPAPVSYTVTSDISGVNFQFGDVVTVTGMVSDTEGTPIPNAYADIYGYGTNGAWNSEEYILTFFDGTYEAFLAQGDYDGYAWKSPCYVESEEMSFALGAGGTGDVDFTITRKCGTITGRVTDEQDDGICNAEVQIEYPTGDDFDTRSTDWDWQGETGIGTYRAWVPLGTWILSASKDGYGDVQPVSRTAKITICGTTVVGQDFQMGESRFIYLPLVLRNS